jgi:hypothetical protein
MEHTVGHIGKEIKTMVSRGPRILLVLASFFLAAGSVMHASAFPKAAKAVAVSNLPAFFGNALKGLWLADSTTMFALALIFALLAMKPFCATRAVVVLASLIPAGIAAMIYLFMGAFFAGHLLLLSAILVLIAGTQFPTSRTSVSAVQRV